MIETKINRLYSNQKLNVLTTLKVPVVCLEHPREIVSIFESETMLHPRLARTDFPINDVLPHD